MEQPNKKEFGDGAVTLVNLTEVSDEEWTEYIGRENTYYNLSESMFSNPYTIDEYSRETAVRLYELWLFENLLSFESFYDSFQSLQDETLACWCLPEPCHGEVLCTALVADLNGELFEHISERFDVLSATLFGYEDEKSAVKVLLSELDSTRFN